MSDKKGLKDAYSLKTPQDSINLYRDWASTYDIDFAKENGYQSPFLIAKYFEKYSYIEDTPILDVGAGTGLIGECMKLSSEQKIDAIDISPGGVETVSIIDLSDQIQMSTESSIEEISILELKRLRVLITLLDISPYNE